MSSRWLSFPLALVVWFVCGCGSAGPPPQQISVNVTPPTMTVRVGDTQQFFATVTGTTNQSVTWSVNGTPGGDSTNGTISLSGLYTPPAQIPAQNQIRVTATSAADASASQSANVTLANPIAVVSSVNPSTLVSGAPFSISVIGSKFLTGVQVLLGTVKLTTTFVDSSHLTATGTAPAAGVLNLTVVNPMPDGTPSAALAVPVIAVNVTPSTTTVRVGDTQQFFANVTGTTNQAVNWSVNGVAGGDATRGTITVAGLYTPPAQPPSPNQVQVTATSAANAGATSSAQVTLANPIAVVSFVYPSTIASNAAFSFSVIGSKFISGAKVLLGTTALTTTFVDSSHLTATGTAQAAPGVVNLTVVNPMPDGTPSSAVAVPVTIVNQRAAVRFLEQSTFGPNDAQLAAVETGGMENFLTAQFQAPTSDVNYPIPPPGMNDVHLLFPVFFQNALDAHASSDQLRQRMMFALNQIWVVSNNKVGQPEFYVPYLRVLTGDAFGNYRNLMEDVTLNPAMGIYLDMVNNAKPDLANGIHANENYAREFMQLFTIGPNLLNPDGTPQIVNGAFVPTYAQADIQALARAFTGWTYAAVAPAASCAQYPNYNRNGGSPMVPCDAYHDVLAKTILGTTLPAGQSAQQDLTLALDNIFKHNNLPPFVARRMIQHFVTSNPSPQYVTRAATAFASGTFTSNSVTFGDGKRGNMRALIAAVLLDPEARRGDDPTTENPVDGHLREPVLFVTNVLRAFHGTTDPNNTLVYLALDMGGEFLFNSGSVFNFFSPLYDIPAADFMTPPASPLSGPEFQIFTSASSLSRVNDIKIAIFSPTFSGSTQIDLSAYASIAANDNDLGTMVDAMNLQLLHGTMIPAMRAEILGAVSAVPNSDPMGRARTAAYLITSSSQYQVQR